MERTMMNYLQTRRLALIAVVTCVAPPAAFAQQRETRVAVSAVVEREVVTGQRAVGTLNPVKVAVIGSAVDGRVVEFVVNRGQFVKSGAKLAQLRTGTLEIELAGAQAERELRAQELAELKAGARPEELAQAAARKLSAKASHEFAKSKYDRTLALFKRGRAATEADLDEARSLSLQAEQALLDATATYDLVKAGPRIERIKQAEARVSLQDERIRLLKDRISKHTLVAPFDGYVTAEHTEVGAWVSQADPVAEVVRLDEVEVEVHVVAQVAALLNRGQDVRLEVAAYPDELITGVIHQIVPQADVRSRTFPVIVHVKNRIINGVPRLKAGMLARVDLPTGTRRKSPLVPKDALVLGGPKPVVYVVDAANDAKSKGQVRAVPVTLGVADGGLIQVDGPLNAGQYVVVRGNERLKSGQQVTMSSVIATDEEPESTTNSSGQTEVGGP